MRKLKCIEFSKMCIRSSGNLSSIYGKLKSKEKILIIWNKHTGFPNKLCARKQRKYNFQGKCYWDTPNWNFNGILTVESK